MRTLLRTSAPVLLAAGLVLAGEAFSQSKGIACSGVEITAVPAGKDGIGAPSFSVSAIEDLEFRVLFSLAPPGEHVLRLRVLMPKGALYQEIAFPFSLDPRFTGRSEAVLEGYPRPVAVRKLEKTRGGEGARWGVSATLPVAGTLVVENSLYGTWQVEPYIDREKTPCAPPVSFDLAP